MSDSICKLRSWQLIQEQIRRETNTFFFTMAKEDHEPIGKMVIPQTYSESMHYLEGKRRLQVGDEMRTLYQGTV
jgi:acyl-coenzyme A thioesterase 9